jgi:antitoxin component YwqK of YwqJK toxin-antitoxin module
MRAMLIFISLFLFLVNAQENSTETKFDYDAYLKQHFNYEITQYTRIKFKNKQDVHDSIFKKVSGSDSIRILKANRFIEKYWPTGIEEFIDTLYTVHPNDTSVKNGLFVCFNGDSTYYNVGIYKNGQKDSIWILSSIDWGKVTVPYKNGKKHGLETIIYPNGAKSTDKYQNGIAIDTSYLYYPSGKLGKREIRKDNKIIKSICYEENGTVLNCQTYELRD